MNAQSFARFFNVVAQSYLYPFLVYFIIVRKSVRTVKKENDGINGNKEISFGTAKKGSFDIIVNGYIDIL